MGSASLMPQFSQERDRWKLRSQSLLLRAAAHCMPSHGETGSVNHVADRGLKLGVGSPALCVAPLKWAVFLTENGERYSLIFIANDREATWPDAALVLG